MFSYIDPKCAFICFIFNSKYKTMRYIVLVILDGGVV